MVLKNPTKHEIGKTIVFFVRHGDRIHIPGALPPRDFSLSLKGVKQAKEVANKFYKIKEEIDAVYSSDLKRAKETAGIISKKINKKFKIIPEFKEIDKILENKNFISYNYLKHYTKFLKTIKKLDEILKKENGKTIIIVAHGRLMKSIIGYKLKIGLRKGNVFDYNNCHITKTRFNGTKIEYINYFNSKELIY